MRQLWRHEAYLDRNRSVADPAGRGEGRGGGRGDGD